MIQQITFSDFCDAFNKMGRSEQFSYAAKRALYDYYEENYCNAYNLDVVGLCCDWEEGAIEYVLDNYNVSTIEELEEDTVVLWIDENTILYQCY